MTAALEIAGLIERLRDAVGTAERQINQGVTLDLGALEGDIAHLCQVLPPPEAEGSPYLPALLGLLDDVERLRRVADDARERAAQQLGDIHRGRLAAAAYRGPGDGR